MMWLHELLKRLGGERVGWFGAGMSAAAVGVVAYQLVVTSFVGLPGLESPPGAVAALAPPRTATSTPSPGRTPTPTHSPTPTRTPTPTSTPAAPDLLATMTLASPDALVAVVATFAARTRRAFDALPITPGPR